MEYLCSLIAATRSFTEFMTEWADRAVHEEPRGVSTYVNLLVSGTLFIEEIDYAHHKLPAGHLYLPDYVRVFSTWRCLDADEREWLNAKYPRWEETYGGLWAQLESGAGERLHGEIQHAVLWAPCPAQLGVSSRAWFIRPGRTPLVPWTWRGRREPVPARSHAAGSSSGRRSAVRRPCERGSTGLSPGSAPGKLIDRHRRGWGLCGTLVETGKAPAPWPRPAWRSTPIPSA